MDIEKRLRELAAREAAAKASSETDVKGSTAEPQPEIEPSGSGNDTPSPPIVQTQTDAPGANLLQGPAIEQEQSESFLINPQERTLLEIFRQLPADHRALLISLAADLVNQKGGQRPSLGKMRAKFKPPATVMLPEADPVVKFEFGAVQRVILDSMTLTITNVTDTPYAVSYAVFGCDSEGRRLSEGASKVQLGVGESVIRQITMEKSGAVPRSASYFILEAKAAQR